MGLRVLIVTPEYQAAGGGIGRFYREVAPALARAGCDVTVVVSNPFADALPPSNQPGLRLRWVDTLDVGSKAEMFADLPPARVFRSWLASGFAAQDVWRALGPFDVVECCDFGLGFAAHVLDADGPPVQVQMHGSLGQISEHEPRNAGQAMDFALARLAEASLLRGADGVQASGQPNASEWRQAQNLNVDVLPPPLAMPTDGPGASDGPVLVVGRVQDWKGPQVLCEALSRLPAGARVPVQWVGRDTATGPGLTSMDGYLARTYPTVWRNVVQPIGARSAQDVAALQRRARFVVVPSLWDTFNLAGAEAMAYGRVVIASDGAGVSDLIQDGVNGFIARAGDAQSFGMAWQKALALDEAARRRMGDAAAEAVRTRMDPDTNARQRMEQLQSRASRGRTPFEFDRWTRDFFSPQPDARVDTSFLESVPVRGLADHLLKRVTKHVSGKAAS